MSHHEILTSEAHEQATAAKTTFGFWIYLMTDLVLFATLFATYAVLKNNTFGGPSSNDLFNIPFVLVETMLLLTSSFTAGLAMLAAHRKAQSQVLVWLGITFTLGASFLAMELYEFHHLVSEGHSWRSSGFLSGFFTLVATHGLHIFVGLLWLSVLIIQVLKKGFTGGVMRRLSLFSMFWHFLDIVWIFIFTIVYLMGVI